MEILDIKEIILENIRKRLLGKELKYLSSWSNFMEPYVVFKKKNGSTNKQWLSGDMRFRVRVERFKHLGRIRIYETSEIKEINLRVDPEDGEALLELTLADGKIVDFDMDTVFEEVMNNIFMTKQSILCFQQLK